MDDVKREQMDVDVLIVGGGCAGMSAAIMVQDLIKKNNLGEKMIVVLEKASEVGAHSFSGAVLNPVALKELIPDYREQGCPIDADVTYDAVYYLSRKGKVKAPITPPPFHNKGNHIISLAKFNRWLGQQAESRGVNIFPGFAAKEALYENGKLVGVRTGDKGLDKHGKPKSNFEPGMDIKAKVTIFAEGTRGSLFRQVSDKLNLRDGKNPEVFEEGVKEIIQMPPGTVTPGQVIHTLGFPMYKSIGGTFIYTIPGDKIILGLVAYLDTHDPLLDPHRDLQRLKTHPFIAEMLKGGKVVAYGGKTLPAGGWYSMPKLYHDNMMVIGDSASMVDVQKLKGIHLGMKSGMLAGEVAFEALQKDDASQAILKSYEEKVYGSFIKKQLYRVRNFHQTLSMGVWKSMPFIALQEITGGRGLCNGMGVKEDYKETLTIEEVWGKEGRNHPDNQLPKPDNILFFDKLSSVYMTGTKHDEDSPNHLIVKNYDTCASHCAPKYGSPCNHFCPANVYEMVPDTDGKQRLQVNYTNCIHCKTCDIKCPSDNILWTVPEGGGGPQYQDT
jgi:electron-transferring-flavoprotein dehydrogenase